MQLSSTKIKLFQQKILTWYEKHKRSLPWREVPVGTTLQQRAYQIFISEVMSQQTQISRVITKYDAWMKAFPTVDALANASVAEVLRYWSGLGYNRRALNLKKTAEIISKTYNGRFPRNEKKLLELPGIGKYTAQAILCFAFDEQIAVVDTNVRKVVMTQFLSCHPEQSEGALTPQDSSLSAQNDRKIDDKLIEEIATKLLPVGRAYDWNQALMDYAAAVLKKEKIAIPKQSKFHGSRRYYRGQVLKYLLKHKKVALAHLGIAIKEDFTTSENEWLQQLVKELINEGFIVQEQGMVALAS